MNDKVVEMAKRGATDHEVAKELGVAVSTIYEWRKSIPEFSESLKAGKDIADSRVVESLYNRAVGFTAPDGTYYPPHPTAGIFWLKNRRPDEWRDTTRSEITGADGGPVEVQGPPRPSPEEVAAYAGELHEGFVGFIDSDTGENAILDGDALATLGEVVARFAAGKNDTTPARELGARFAEFAKFAAAVTPPASFRGIEAED